ncbi:hypothetical protein GCM10025868_11180 [Angustibacter aerolatus]|uniref:Cytochrome P450 n=1 Tax=Angustibacter aerolatus TaxID=1162965 RepID=A0ABQ6JCF9_9ACTN|nr:hypothetical protein GCM10025868_11180 [Angustibacter aerolatus]
MAAAPPRRRLARPRALRPEPVRGERAGTPRPTYLPFGLGPRLCIGRDFAVVESVLALAALLRDWTVSPVVRGGQVVRPRVDALVTLRPHGGLPLVVRRR